MSSVRKQSLIATLAISGSRVAGLMREIVFAFFFGASAVLDAYIAAFRIPNLLRDLFSEGALSQAFVSVFSKKRAAHGDKAAFELAYLVSGFILVTVGSLTIAGILFAPQIVSSIASGFEGSKFELTVSLTRYLFPFILFVSFAAVLMGMHNTMGRFGLPQSASTFFNIGSIVIGILAAYLLSPTYISQLFSKLLHNQPILPPTWDEATNAILGMTIGTLAGGLLQWLIQLPPLWRLGFKNYFKFDLKNKDLAAVLKLTGPAIIGGAAVQLNVLINTNFASYLTDGSISWLNYAFRLMQFPIGVFGVAIASATAPELARRVAQNDHESIIKTIRSSLSMALFLCIPSALGLMALAQPIISLIYERGHFNTLDSYHTSLALQAYALGLSFYSLIKIYQPAFLAFGNAKTPMLISLFSILLNAVLNYVFVFVLHFDHWGLALGTSSVASINFILLNICLRKYISGIWNKQLILNSFLIIIAALVAATLAHTSLSFLTPHFTSALFTHRFILVFVPILIAVLTYFITGNLFRIPEIKSMLLTLKQRRGLK